MCQKTVLWFKDLFLELSEELTLGEKGREINAARRNPYSQLNHLFLKQIRLGNVPTRNSSLNKNQLQIIRLATKRPHPTSTESEEETAQQQIKRPRPNPTEDHHHPTDIPTLLYYIKKYLPSRHEDLQTNAKSISRLITSHFRRTSFDDYASFLTDEFTSLCKRSRPQPNDNPHTNQLLNILVHLELLSTSDLPQPPSVVENCCKIISQLSYRASGMDSVVNLFKKNVENLIDRIPTILCEIYRQCSFLEMPESLKEKLSTSPSKFSLGGISQLNSSGFVDVASLIADGPADTPAADTPAADTPAADTPAADAQPRPPTATSSQPAKPTDLRRSVSLMSSSRIVGRRAPMFIRRQSPRLARRHTVVATEPARPRRLKKRLFDVDQMELSESSGSDSFGPSSSTPVCRKVERAGAGQAEPPVARLFPPSDEGSLNAEDGASGLIFGDLLARPLHHGTSDQLACGVWLCSPKAKWKRGLFSNSFYQQTNEACSSRTLKTVRLFSGFGSPKAGAEDKENSLMADREPRTRADWRSISSSTKVAQLQSGNGHFLFSCGSIVAEKSPSAPSFYLEREDEEQRMTSQSAIAWSNLLSPELVSASGILSPSFDSLPPTSCSSVSLATSTTTSGLPRKKLFSPLRLSARKGGSPLMELRSPGK